MVRVTSEIEMALKRRQEYQRQAREGGRAVGGPKPSKKRYRSGLELFYGEVLTWRPDDLNCEEALAPLPVSFCSASDYFSKLKVPILAEAKAVLANRVVRWPKSLIVSPTGDDEDVLPWGARLLFLSFERPPTLELREALRPGQVFTLRHGRSTILATWANGLARRGKQAPLVLMINDAWFPKCTGNITFELTPLESLLSLQRMFDACVRQPRPPFFQDMLCVRKSKHTVFQDSDEEEDVQSDHGSGTSGAEPNASIDEADLHGNTVDVAFEGSEVCGGLAAAAYRGLNASQRAALDDFAGGRAGELHGFCCMVRFG